MNRDQLWVAGVLALLAAIFVGECVYAVTADYQPPAEQNESDCENSSIVIEPSQDGIEITDGCTDGNSGKNEPPVTGPVLELGE